jgi:inositol 1,4,5-triphosphate receptor type 3
LYYSIYIIAGIVGLTVHPFFFAFHLMDFLKLEQLKTVLDAMWRPREEIGLALLLLSVIEYYVGILGFIIFYDDYPVVNSPGCIVKPDNDKIMCERGCSTMW